MAIRTLIWGENVHEQINKTVAEIYPEGMHNQIAKLLKSDTNLSVKTTTLQEPEHGLTDKVLEETDVLIWWGHRLMATSPTKSSSASPSGSGKAWD